MAATTMAAAVTGIEILMENSMAGAAAVDAVSGVMRDIIRAPLGQNRSPAQNETGTYSCGSVVAMVEWQSRVPVWVASILKDGGSAFITTPYV